ncbi:L,D-transpeptidase family protein [Streptomyces sp. NPDC059558]|uniref:L,D-transpeptidase family protein n=1 Tax=unclassified Streptomyces TaxID=2593676 RepID=UPI0006C33D4A|nr:L,D-transpeptidase family protein [Streptomyces sp. WM6368]KOU34695.1 lipoprotein [Streptomyces sp. WM6368]
MSKHARARSRPSGKPRPIRRTRRVALAAALGLATFTAGWVYVAQDQDKAAAARPQARADARPQAEDRAARDAQREAARRAAEQGLTGVSEQTRARIPAESRQLILVTGKAADSSESTAAFYTRPAAGADWVKAESWPARNGANGWSVERAYGDLTSPQGVFALTDAGGLLPKPPGTRLPYDRDNGFVATGLGVNGESLVGSFDYVVAIDFNRRPGRSPLDPVMPDGEDKGGNIWLHVDHDGPSQGCVGIPKEAMKKVLETLDPAAKPVIVMGPEGF